MAKVSFSSPPRPPKPIFPAMAMPIFIFLVSTISVYGSMVFRLKLKPPKLPVATSPLPSEAAPPMVFCGDAHDHSPKSHSKPVVFTPLFSAFW